MFQNFLNDGSSWTSISIRTWRQSGGIKGLVSCEEKLERESVLFALIAFENNMSMWTVIGALNVYEVIHNIMRKGLDGRQSLHFQNKNVHEGLAWKKLTETVYYTFFTQREYIPVIF